MEATQLICTDCKQPFDFTEKDQAFFEKMGFAPPKRCLSCRKTRRSNRESGNVHQSGSSRPDER